MPRPVVPSRREPRKRSVTLSSTRLYGGMRWALALTTRREVSTPRASQRVDLLEQHAEVDDDAVADDRGAAGAEDAAGQQVQGVLLAVDDDGVAGVVAAVELHDVVDAAAQQVGRLALAFVAPLGSDQHDRRHPGHLPRIVVTGRCTTRPDRRRLTSWTGAPARRRTGLVRPKVNGSALRGPNRAPGQRRLPSDLEQAPLLGGDPELEAGVGAEGVHQRRTPAAARCARPSRGSARSPRPCSPATAGPAAGGRTRWSSRRPGRAGPPAQARSNSAVNASTSIRSRMTT